MERELVGRAPLPIPFHAVSAAGVHGVGLRRLPANALLLARGFGQALRLVRQLRPAAVLLTGGYVAPPVALAAWLHRAPLVLYVPDIEPGLALKALSRLATRIMVTAEDSRPYFSTPDRVEACGYPTRPDLVVGGAVSSVGGIFLAPDRDTLLVFGGSRGARSINRALAAILDSLLLAEDLQVIHISGELDWPEVRARRKALPPEGRARYLAFPYLHGQEMGRALAAADLAVARAGASTLGEFPLFGLPAILVPYPHAWRYQKVNADYLVRHGAALRLNDQDLGRDLLPLIRELLAPRAGPAADRPRLAKMKAAARALATPDAAQRIARALLAVAGSGAAG